MALIDKLKAIADAIRNKTGYSLPLTLEEMPDMIETIEGNGAATYSDMTYILVDENGYEIPAVLTEEEVALTATAASDIRAGTTAVTDEGVVTGEKEIPAYYTEQGVRIVKPGQALDIYMYSDRCQYTKLQVIICAYNTSDDDSVSAEMVVINDNLYEVKSTEALASVSVDTDAQSIKLGITNESESSLIIRYVTIKEE